MPKSDALGGFNTVETPVAGFKAEAGSPDRPPLEARDIVQKLCDDRRMQAQIAAAIDERLRDLGGKALGDRLVAHALVQKSAWLPAFYNAYYLVLTNYLEEINYAGGTAPEVVVETSAVPVVIPNGATAVATAPAPTGTRTLKERLNDLKELRAEDIITQEEFDERRKAILAEV